MHILYLQGSVRCPMQEFVLSFMGEYGYAAVFLLILIENLFPPIPSEVILTFGGVMTTCTELSAAGVILAATAGSVLGAVCLYLAGAMVPEPLLKKLLEGRAGSLLHFHPEDLELARGWFLKRGKGAVFFCRLVPIVRSLISVPAGVAGMEMAPFLILTALGSLLWNTILVFAGRAAGASWERVAASFGTYGDLFLLAAGSTLCLYMMVRSVKNR